jgi:alanyl-tRNA synthetase
VFVVTDTQRKGELILHLGYVSEGVIKGQEKVHARVDEKRRQAIRLNHTATHLLHAALRDILGDTVTQKGSLVSSDRSRFDFSFNRALNRDEMKHVEQWVNAKVRQNVLVETELLSLEKAQERGAMALFGEKYGEEVRVLSMGDFSQELCGGTHATRTGDIGFFKILSEAGIASGIRRIEFVTAQCALDAVQEQNQFIADMAQVLKTSPELLAERVLQNQQHTQKLQQQLQQFEKKLMLHQAREWVAQHQTNWMIRREDGYDVKSLRLLSDLLRDLKPHWMFILYSIQGDNINVMVSVPKSLQNQVGSAADWVKILCPRGGGRPDFAQGGGPVPEDLEQQLTRIAEKLNCLV